MTGATHGAGNTYHSGFHPVFNNNGVRVARSLVFWVKNKNADISAHATKNVL